MFLVKIRPESSKLMLKLHNNIQTVVSVLILTCFVSISVNFSEFMKCYVRPERESLALKLKHRRAFKNQMNAKCSKHSLRCLIPGSNNLESVFNILSNETSIL